MNNFEQYYISKSISKGLGSFPNFITEMKRKEFLSTMFAVAQGLAAENEAEQTRVAQQKADQLKLQRQEASVRAMGVRGNVNAAKRRADAAEAQAAAIIQANNADALTKRQLATIQALGTRAKVRYAGELAQAKIDALNAQADLNRARAAALPDAENSDEKIAMGHAQSVNAGNRPATPAVPAEESNRSAEARAAGRQLRKDLNVDKNKKNTETAATGTPETEIPAPPPTTNPRKAIKKPKDNEGSSEAESGTSGNKGSSRAAKNAANTRNRSSSTVTSKNQGGTSGNKGSSKAAKNDVNTRKPSNSKVTPKKESDTFDNKGSSKAADKGSNKTPPKSNNKKKEPNTSGGLLPEHARIAAQIRRENLEKKRQEPAPTNESVNYLLDRILGR